MGSRVSKFQASRIYVVGFRLTGPSVLRASRRISVLVRVQKDLCRDFNTLV